MAKVLLMNAGFNLTNLREDHPMGLVYLATSLKKRGHDVKVVDFYVEKVDPKRIINDFSPAFIGISTTTDSRFNVFSFCEQIKALSPDTKTVLGGPHFMGNDKETLQHHHSVDFILRGYCEKSLPHLVSGKSPEDIYGLTFRKNGTTYQTPFIGKPDPSDFLIPDYRLLNLKKYQFRTDHIPSLPLFTSRGCCNHCTFCSAGYFSKTIAFAPVDSVIENINYIASLGYKAIRIQDDTFGMNRKIAYEILEHLKKREIIYSVKSRISILDEDFLQILKETGCRGIKFGLESIVPKVLSSMNKKLDIEKLESILNFSNKIDLPMGAFVMIGNPDETYEDAITTIDYCQNLLKRGIYPISTVGCYIFPGTMLENIAKKEGLIPEDFCWAASFYDSRNERLGYEPSIPVYISQYLGYSELYSLADEIKKRNLFVLEALIPF